MVEFANNITNVFATWYDSVYIIATCFVKVKTACRLLPDMYKNLFSVVPNFSNHMLIIVDYVL